MLLVCLIFATGLIALENQAELEYEKSKDLLSKDPDKAISDLQHIYGSFKHVKSLETILDHYLFKVHDYKKSLEYAELLAQDGHPYGHFVKGVFLSANISQPENSVQQSLIHLALASRDRHLPSLMAMGYRYKKGIGFKESCSKSLQYYKAAAKIVVKHRTNGPPLGTLLPPLPVHLEAADGGLYGHISHSTPSDRIFGDESSGISEEDIIDYSKMLAESGDISSQYLLGQVFYQGLQNFKQSYQIAFMYFKKAADAVDKPQDEDDDISSRTKDKLFGGKSASMVGRMYLRGEYVTKNNAQAYEWFKKSADIGDGMAYSGLGYMYEFGLHTAVNMKKAITMYTKAAERQDAYGLTRLGKYYKDNKDYIASSNYLNIASHLGNVQASYLLGDMLENGLGVTSDCKQAVSLFKKVAETGYEWFYPYTVHAYESLANNDVENSLINYLFASEMGIELAQVNLAYLIDNKIVTSNSSISLPIELRKLALTQFHRASNQGNIDARIKAGDYHYIGFGVEEDKKQAFEYYKAASDDRSSYAAWNLGYMYENGIGVVQVDYNMAMRFYDLAYEYNKDTWLVVSLSNLKLRLRWSWSEFKDYFYSSSDSESRGSKSEPIIAEQATPMATDIDWEIDDMRTPTWKRNGNDYFSMLEHLFFESSASSGMDNLVFFALIIVSGYLFYLRRRNERQRPVQIPAVTNQPNPRLNALLEQMRQQQRDRINQQVTQPIDEPTAQENVPLKQEPTVEHRKEDEDSTLRDRDSE
eukprot:NODE_78_length_23131_cov_0.599427.p1 type:complete len:757 gc:universal NODE_78_length_23131_cov_0.599427:6777-4507(-)